jgi:CRISP-associated protein Cas1
MLISLVRTEIVAAGLDPSIGIAHRRAGNPIPLVYDLMEPLRPVVDRKVFEFALSNTFTPGDFTITRLGGCRLNPQLAKSVAKHIAGLECRNGIENFLNRLV